MCTLLTNMIPLSIPLSSCALKMGCSHELAYVDTSILEAYFFGMRADTFCCISLASPLSPFCCIRATLFVASLSHITLPLLRVRPPAVPFTNYPKNNAAAVVLYATLFYRAYLQQ